MSKKRVLVVGSGGREHALVNALAISPSCECVFAVPGNDGMKAVATCLTQGDQSLSALVQAHSIDVVVFGPEQPVVDGEADALEGLAIVVGPSAAAAQLEGSKAFMKDVCVAAGVPTAKHATFGADQLDDALAYVQAQGAPIVIKASGLAAGKGVTVAEDLETALAATRDCLSGDAFGEAGLEVVIEECMVGPEVSVFHLVTKGKAKFLGAAQDHKRQLDGDKGPNTGGMGTFSPSPLVDDGLVEQVERDVIYPVLAEMAARDAAFEGFLFTGLMLTAQGPKLLEFNVRMGDPETQSLLPRIRGDFLEALINPTVQVEHDDRHAVTVVLAAPGYPVAPEKGLAMPALPANCDDLCFTVAGAKQDGDEGTWVSTGGRVLGVTGLGASHEEARTRAYDAIKEYGWEAAQFRTDIGAR